MRRRRLGKSGFEVSEIGLGCWQLGGDFGPLGEATAEEILAAADEASVTLWDTADVYGSGLSETRIGNWIRTHPQPRVVISKVGRDRALYPNQYTRKGIRQSIEGSVRRLGVEALDLVQLHCVPQEHLESGEVFGWLEDLIQDGLIRHFGASVETLDEALFCLECESLSSLQIIFNLFRQDAADQLFERAQDADVGIIVRLPLASGILSGKLSKDHVFAAADHRNYNANGEVFSVGETFSGIPFEKAVELAEAVQELLPMGSDLAEVALRWILDHDAVTTVIAGCSRAYQVERNARVSELSPLSPALHQRLGEFYREEVRAHIRSSI